MTFYNNNLNKRAGMMQPYLFPYLGYFQLISAVDVFVLGDDLQYEKESWINRNRILIEGKDKLITFPLKKGNHCLKINERFLSDDFSKVSDKLLRIIYNAYVKAPCFKKVFPFIEEIIKFPESNLAKYAENSIRRIRDYLGITTTIIPASDLSIENVIDKQDRVIKTARKINAQVCINLIGGMNLYNQNFFREQGIELKFHRMDHIQYKQFNNDFVPFLSIIDVLMFNEVHEVQEKLSLFTLQDHSSPEPFTIE
jgi:hypothetical protein